MLAVSDDSSFPRARLVVPGVPCEPGAADGAWALQDKRAVGDGDGVHDRGQQVLGRKCSAW